MIHKQAVKIVSVMEKKKIIAAASAEVYVYGFELIISALINILLIAIISITLRRHYDWILFLIAFIPLRATAGGYHAKTHLKCVITGTIVFTAMLALNQLHIDWMYIIPVISGLSLVMILIFSPVEAHNKKLKDKQVIRNRKLSINIATVNIAVTIIIFIFPELSSILSIYFLGVLSAAISMLAVKIQKSERRGEDEIREELVS